MKQENFKRELASLLKRYNAELEVDVSWIRTIKVCFYALTEDEFYTEEDLGDVIDKNLKYESEEK